MTPNETRMAWAAADVVRTHVTFKTMVTKFSKNTTLRQHVSVAAVTSAANELYFAARLAYRFALRDR